MFNELFAEGEVNVVVSLTIFTKPEEKKCFSIIAQVIIRTTGFSIILFV